MRFGSDENFLALVESSPEALLIINNVGKICIANASAKQLFGYTAAEFQKLTVEDLMPKKYRARHIKLREDYMRHPQIRKMSKVKHLFISTKLNKVIPVDIGLIPIRHEGNIFVLCTLIDLSIQKKQDRELLHYVEKLQKAQEALIEKNKHIEYISLHDPLTNTLNKISLERESVKCLARAKRYKNNSAFLFIDIDDYKFFNDKFGHRAGDIALKAVADRLVSLVRKVDFLGRFGGDEFVLVLDAIAKTEDAEKAAAKIIDAFATPFQLEQHSLNITLSIGVAVFPDDGETVSILLKHADFALHEAKRTGKNKYVRFQKQ